MKTFERFQVVEPSKSIFHPEVSLFGGLLTWNQLLVETCKCLEEVIEGLASNFMAVFTGHSGFCLGNGNTWASNYFGVCSGTYLKGT